MEDRTKKVLVSTVIGFILVISTFGVIFYGTGDSVETYKYKDKIFVKAAYGWAVSLNGAKVVIETDPRELDNIEVPEINIAQLNSAQKVYLSVNPNDDGLARTVAAFNTYIRPYVTTLWIPACSVDDEKCSNAPLKGCGDASITIRVIEFKEDNETKISYKNNCLLVQGKEPELTRYTDRIILKMLGL